MQLVASHGPFDLSWMQAHRRGGLALNPSQVGFHLIKRERPPIPFTPEGKNPILSSREPLTTCLTCAIVFASQDLPTKEVLRQEQHIRRALRQPPHKVRIPLGAEWDINSHAPAVFHQGLLQVAPDAV
jgi:hypothetical protein